MKFVRIKVTFSTVQNGFGQKTRVCTYSRQKMANTRTAFINVSIWFVLWIQINLKKKQCFVFVPTKKYYWSPPHDLTIITSLSSNTTLKIASHVMITPLRGHPIRLYQKDRKRIALEYIVGFRLKSKIRFTVYMKKKNMTAIVKLRTKYT